MPGRYCLEGATAIGPSMKQLLLLGFVLATAVAGVARFGGGSHPAPRWLDVAFVVSAAAAVGVATSLINAYLRAAASRAMHGPDSGGWPQGPPRSSVETTASRDEPDITTPPA